MNTDFIIFSAYREIIDPGAPAKSFDAARAVLKLRPDWFAAKLTANADLVFNDCRAPVRVVIPRVVRLDVGARSIG